MRKTMTKEITFTTCEVAEMQIVKGQPKVVQLEPERFIGNWSQGKIERELRRMYKKPLTVFNIQQETKIYEMDVEEFMKHATIKGDNEEAEEGEENE